ncbi:DUF2939 domain-containing protein [Psychrobacter sp. AOP22-C1-C5]|uniref:DUF2939 domain-containing protein n=1 Tax=Psychrobacter sp. AOP22-C1-C5 TaxID=3457716 RepID=UPI0040369007
MKKILSSVVILLVLVAGYLYASPYLALNSIKNAAQARDADKLSSYIDFPSVKQSVKDQFKAKLAAEMITSENNDGFEALGSMFATAMIDPIVDGLITPEGVAAIMLKEQEQDSPEATGIQEEPKELEYETSYDSFNSFHVDINNTERDDNVKVILHRQGLSWKITNIDFPLNNF